MARSAAENRGPLSVFFGEINTVDAIGAVLAHSIRLPDGTIKKGTALDAGHIERLKAAGCTTITVARLDADDLHEDEAATRLASPLRGDGVRIDEAFTGRVNIYAETDGIVHFDPDAIRRINRHDPRLTVATLPENTRVFAGQMLATVKIIPYAVDEKTVDAAVTLAGATRIAVAAFRAKHVSLIVTRVAGEKESLVEKRQQSVASRVASLGGKIMRSVVVEHSMDAVARDVDLALADNPDLILLFGGAAISDTADTLPGALAKAGGTVGRVGMPVDPGNLSMTGTIGSVPVIGVPSCAASPKLNGFDWILERSFADRPIDSNVIADMGVGGLLSEIPERTQPRTKSADQANPGDIAAIVLAAGRSTRMQDGFKLLEPIDGKPMVLHAVDAAMSSQALTTIAVTGHRANEIKTLLDDRVVLAVENKDYGQGLSTSLRSGIRALPTGIAGAVVLLGDMPFVTPMIINRLIDSFVENGGRSVCVPTHRGKRGNPILWPASLFEEMIAVTGDQGARSLLRRHAPSIIEVEIDDDGIFVDIDDRETLTRANSSRT